MSSGTETRQPQASAASRTPSVNGGPATPGAAAPEPKKGIGGWAIARRVAAAIWLGLGVLAVASGLPRVCRTEVAGTAAVETCTPMGVTDAPVVMYVLVLAALVFFEISEVQINGLVTLKRQITEAKTEASEAKGEAAQTRTELAQIRNAISVRSEVAANAIASPVLTVNHGPTDAQIEQIFRTTLALLPGRPTLPSPEGAQPAVVFKAAFRGLASQLPVWAQDAIVIGTVPTDDGAGWVTQSVAPTEDLGDVEQWTTNVLAALQSEPAVEELDDDVVVVAAPAYGPIDPDVRVGALVVVARPPEGVDVDDELVPQVVNLATAYGYMLVALLGEGVRVRPGGG
jgi:hypothetical protein